MNGAELHILYRRMVLFHSTLIIQPLKPNLCIAFYGSNLWCFLKKIYFFSRRARYVGGGGGFPSNSNCSIPVPFYFVVFFSIDFNLENGKQGKLYLKIQSCL